MSAGEIEQKSGRVTLRMEPSLHARLEQAAHNAGMDLNGAIVYLIRKGLPEMIAKTSSQETAMRKPKIGSITFRLDPAKHQQLLDMAKTLGTDLSGIVKMMLAEVTPAFLERAEKIRNA